jgi:hypothetical protein
VRRAAVRRPVDNSHHHLAAVLVTLRLLNRALRQYLLDPIHPKPHLRGKKKARPRALSFGAKYW